MLRALGALPKKRSREEMDVPKIGNVIVTF